jgi:membrane associated rhomboid family serine protease
VSQSPDRRDRTRPAELLGLSAVIAGFVGVIAFMSTRDIVLALIGLGATFILVLVVVATLALTISGPSAVEKLDLDEQDREQDRGH